jgi:hypothetical protein
MKSDARCRQNLCDDDNAKFHLASGDKLRNNVRFRSCDLRLDTLGDSEALDHLVHMEATPTLR